MAMMKWAAIALAGSVAAAIGALWLIPHWVDLSGYRTAAEAAISKAAGQPARIAELRLHLFPWAGVSVRGVAVAAPAGFSEPDLVSVPSAELRMGLIPLLRREVRIERLVLHAPHVVLETTAEGRFNWFSKSTSPGKPGAAPTTAPAPAWVFPAAASMAEEVRVEEGRLTLLDARTGGRREIRRLKLSIDDLSLDRLVRYRLAALADGGAVSAEGVFGPVGPNLGGGAIPLELSLEAFGLLRARVAGSVRNVLVGPVAEVALTVDEFSPRRVLAALGRAVAGDTAPDAWHRLSFQAAVQAEGGNVSVTAGTLQLDDTRSELSLRAADWGRRGVVFEVHVNDLDLDRYLASGRSASRPGSGAPPGAPAVSEPALALPIPKLKGTVSVERLTAGRARLERVSMQLSGTGGVLTIDPFTASLYDGSMSGRAAVDVRPGGPHTSLEATLADVQLGPLLKDISGRGAIEGRGRAEVVLSGAGLDASALLHTLSGHGRLVLVDGAIAGLDLLAAATRNPSAGGPRTELSELTIPFTAEAGRIQIAEATGRSGVLHLRGSGQIDLVQENLNLKIEPRMAGEGGIGVRVTGRFSAPEVRPDVEGVARKALRKALEGDGDGVLRKSGERLKGLLPNTTKSRGDTGP